MLYKDTGKRLYGANSGLQKPDWMTDDEFSKIQRGGSEYRPMTDRWTALDYTRPKEWQTFSKATNQPIAGGVWKPQDVYRTYQPMITRSEFRENLTNAFSQSPLNTRTEGGQLIAEKTLDPTGVAGYGKWGHEEAKQPITHKWILPQGALDFKFAQSNAPLSDAQRSGASDIGGNYSNLQYGASPTRLTSGAFKVSPQRAGQSISGGVTDYTRGKTYMPSKSWRTGAITSSVPASYKSFDGLDTSSWDDEWAQKKGYKNYKDYLESIGQ
jgi:hypothetical protein